MTVQTTNNTAVFDGNGVATVFSFGFPFKANGDIKLYSKDASGVVQPVLAGFTLAGAGSPNGGTVTMASPPATGTKLVVAREMVIKQLIDLRNQGKFFPETHEEAFDILTMLIQQVSERVDRAVKVDISGDSDPDALIEGISNVAVAAQASANSAASSASASASHAANSAASAAASAASASAADTAKSKAQKWADEAEDVAVEPGKFSAKHWAAKAMAALSSLTSRVTTVESKVATIEAGMPQKPELLWSGAVGSNGVALDLARPLVAGDIVWLQHSDGAKSNSAPQVITSELLSGGRALGFTFGQSGATGMTVTNASRFTTNSLTAGFGVEKIFASKAGV